MIVYQKSKLIEDFKNDDKVLRSSQHVQEKVYDIQSSKVCQRLIKVQRSKLIEDFKFKV